MALSESALKAIKQAQSFHKETAKDLAKQSDLLFQKKELLHAIQEAQHFSFQKDPSTFSESEYWRLFAREWGEKILEAARILKSVAPSLKIEEMPLPEGPVFLVARDLFLQALNPKQKKNAFFEDLYQTCTQLRSPEELHWVRLPQGTTLPTLRDFFDCLEKYVLVKVYGAVAAKIPSPKPQDPSIELDTTDELILKFLKKNNATRFQTSPLATAIHRSSQGIGKNLSKLCKMELIKNTRRKGYEITPKGIEILGV